MFQATKSTADFFEKKDTFIVGYSYGAQYMLTFAVAFER